MQCVMALLLVLSIWSWSVIIRKLIDLRLVSKQIKAFAKQFKEITDLNTLYVDSQKSRNRSSPAARVFEAGMHAYLKSRQARPANSDTWLEITHRSMNTAIAVEIARLEQGLPFLASVGSVSPYIGLFGTVWGIMNSFRGLANAQQSTLANVAPGIAEALVATAIGLFAAIPATVAYNRYASEIEIITTHLDNLSDELLNVLQRQSR